MLLKYCTKCDVDVYTHKTECHTCNSGAHLIERDGDDKCGNCGERWGDHGAMAPAGMSASACPAPATTHFAQIGKVGIAFHDFGTRGLAADATITTTTITSKVQCRGCGDFSDYANPEADGKFACYCCRQSGRGLIL